MDSLIWVFASQINSFIISYELTWVNFFSYILGWYDNKLITEEIVLNLHMIGTPSFNQMNYSLKIDK